MASTDDAVLRFLAHAVEDGTDAAWTAAERAARSEESVELVRNLRQLLRLGAAAEADRATERADDPCGDGPTELHVHVDPTRLGPYRLVQPLGEGAMGIVYEAEQERPVRRRVALKVIKHAMPTRQAVARFEAERQALALMNHPHIAQVYDGGLAPDGRPYLAMEFIRGIPLTEYCDRRRLPIDERLALFISICEAVQHAHQKGVIHRDLKPSNILVTELGGRPFPKVIDFGVAKAVGQQLTERTLLTHVGHVVGTPAYMSPEQADPTGLDIDTRADVYALGVLLYELLVGSRPFESKKGEPPASIDEMRRRIVHLEPTRPSTRAAMHDGDGETAGQAARLRQTEPRMLARQLRGELDWIVLKALEKDRNRRYASAGDFAEDVRRFLDGRPVQAGAPGKIYRAKKFISRHRFGASAAALVFVSLAAGLAGTAVNLVRAREAQQAAQHEAETARQVSEFLVELFEVSDPNTARGNTVTAREILDAGAVRIERRLADQPLVQARLFEAMGRVYGNIGEQASARALLERALALRRPLLGAEHPDALRLEALLGPEEPAARRKHLERVLAAQERALGPDHLDCAWTRYFLGATLIYYEPAESRRLLSLALAAFERAQRQGAAGGIWGALRGLTWTHNDLGAAWTNEARWPEALREFEAALALSERELPPDHPELVLRLTSVAMTRSELGRPDHEIVPLFERALAIGTKALGADHVHVAMARNAYGEHLLRVGDLRGARKQLDAAHEALRAAVPPDHPYVPMNRRLVAELLLREGNLDAAARIIDESVNALRRHRGLTLDLDRALAVQREVRARQASVR